MEKKLIKKQFTLLSLVLLCCIASSNAQSFTPTRKVVFEDHTQCSFGSGFFSPRGIVYMDSFIRSPYASAIEIISVHASVSGPPEDPMLNEVYSDGAVSNPFLPLSGWPSVIMDRKTENVMEIATIFSDYFAVEDDFGVADIALSLDYDTTTRSLDVTATAHFAVNANNYNLALVLTEDSVHGTTIEYSQRNGYSGGGLGPMAGAGIDFVAQPNPVPADLMYYRNVARAILPSFAGEDASLPATALADSFYTYTFPTYTVPADYDASKMRAIVLLINSTNGQIVNANGADLANSFPTGIHELSAEGFSLKVFPNPFSQFTSVEFTLPATEGVHVRVSNNLGQHVSTHDMGVLNAGEHSFEWDGSDLANGIYFVTLETARGSLTRTVVVEK